MLNLIIILSSFFICDGGSRVHTWPYPKGSFASTCSRRTPEILCFAGHNLLLFPAHAASRLHSWICTRHTGACIPCSIHCNEILFNPFRIARGSGVAPLFSFSSHVRHHADASTEHLGKSTQKQVPRWWRPQVEVITKTLRPWVMPTIYFFREYRSRLK